STQPLPDEPVEVVAALVVRLEARLHLRTERAQLLRQIGVLRADDLRDLLAQALRERRRRTPGRDGDGDRPLAVHGGQDEGAELGDVGDVAEQGALLGVAEDALVQSAVVGRRDDDVCASQQAAPVALRRHADDRRTARLEPGDLLVGGAAVADDDGTATAQVEAGHVVVLHQAPRLASRAPALPSRSTSSKSAVEIVIPYSPGPTAFTVTRSSSRPESAASASFSSRVDCCSSLPAGRRR